MFVNGPKEETHIVKSISDFSVSKVIVAQFLASNRLQIRFANLDGMLLRSTAEALDAITTQLALNFIPDAQYNVHLAVFPDTTYSCNEELLRLSRTTHFSSYFINDQAVSPSSQSTDWIWTFSEPTCYAARAAQAQDRLNKDLCQDGWCSDPTPAPEDPYREACNETYTECRHYVDESAMTSRPSTAQFWNLHIPAKIVFHPKHHSTGRIMMEESLDEAQATALRRQAVDNPGEDRLKPYLNMVFDDSASVYFSGQFIPPSTNPNSIWELALDVPAQGEGGTSFSHDPPVAFRIRSFNDREGLQAALLMPFAKSNEEREFLRTIDLSCPGWLAKDRRIGERAFTIRDDVAATLPDILPTDPSDGTWKKLKQERVALPGGGFSVRTFYEDDRVLTGQRAIVRNTQFPYSDYFWKGCPDLENDRFQLTKSQLASFLNKSIPTCNITSVYQAAWVYNSVAEVFSDIKDSKERTLAEKRRAESSFHFDRLRDRERPETYECPPTALDNVIERLR